MQSMNQKTTGWTEATRNQFHPGDIITAFRLDYSIYSPHGSLGVAELVWHFLGYGRGEVEVDENGVIHHFSYVMDRTESIQADLRQHFPELAVFADSLQEKDMQLLCSNKSYASLINNIEQKFGKTVIVFPCTFTQKISKDLLEKGGIKQQENMEQKWHEIKTPVTNYFAPKKDDEKPETQSPQDSYCGFSSGFLL